MDNVVVFSLNSSKELTEKICKRLKIEEGKIEIRHFADGEILVELLETVRDKRVYIIQSTDNPVSQNLMELLIAIDSVKRAFAKRIDVIKPIIVNTIIVIIFVNCLSSSILNILSYSISSIGTLNTSFTEALKLTTLSFKDILCSFNADEYSSVDNSMLFSFK